MSLLLTSALLASTATLPACSWDRPGVHVFMGDVVASVDRYADIPSDVRARLKQRMAVRRYDEMATITRDAITGKARYSPELREMHFGQGTVCRTVSRSRWSDQMVERGPVYCEGEHCLIVPTVCRNLSRITRLPDRVAADGDTAPDLPGVAKTGTPIDPLRLAQASGMEVPEGSPAVATEPPGAGMPATAPTGTFNDLSKPLIGGVAAAPIGGPSNPGINLGSNSPAADTPNATNTAPNPLANTPVAWPPDALPIGGGAPPIGVLPRGPEGVAAIPEPKSWALWAAGLGAVLVLARRRRQRDER